MNNEKRLVSYFNSVTDTSPKKITFGEVINYIRDGVANVEVQSIRDLYKDGRQKEGDEMKKKLPAFTASGVFNQGHKACDLVEYAGRIILDFDKLGDKVVGCKKKAKELPFTESTFISPSGAGLKVTVRVDSPKEEHKKMFGAVKQYYEQALGVPADPSGKDVSRLCFLSCDEDVYYNPASQIFTYEDQPEMPVVKKAKKIEVPQGATKRVDQVLNYCEQKYDFTPGNRNDSLFKTACWANELGIPTQELIDEATKRYSAPDFTSKEIEDTISHVYKDNAEHFGEKSNEAISDKNDNCDKNDTGNASETTLEEEETEEQLLRNTPYIPDEVWGKLPKILKEILPCAKSKRERDILLLGSIVALGGCMSTVYGEYDGKVIFPYLYLFVAAPAAQGKGVVGYANKLIEKYHELLWIESEREVKVYEQQLEDFEALSRKKGNSGKGRDLSKKPEEKHYKLLILPPNESRASLLRQLLYNDSLGGIMFAAEAETQADSSNEFIHKSDMYRCCFHHETISSNYKVDGPKPLVVKTPKLAKIETGTLNQLFKVLPSSENGLFSRYSFYTFFQEPEFRDVSPQGNREKPTELISRLATSWCDQADTLRKKKLEITFSSEQWDRFHQLFSQLVKDSFLAKNPDFAGVVYRAGVICFRIGMILTGLRECDSFSALEERQCSDDDFEIATEITLTCLRHSLLISTAMTPSERKVKFQSPTDTAIAKIISLMPSTFTTGELREKVQQYDKMSIRTVQRSLGRLEKDGVVQGVKKGVWSKIGKNK